MSRYVPPGTTLADLEKVTYTHTLTIIFLDSTEYPIVYDMTSPDLDETVAHEGILKIQWRTEENKMRANFYPLNRIREYFVEEI